MRYTIYRFLFNEVFDLRVTFEISLLVNFKTPPRNFPTDEKRIEPTSPEPTRFCFDR
jgi:hypothetical protein